jgi:hypothetical protein
MGDPAMHDVMNDIKHQYEYTYGTTHASNSI